MKLTLVQKGTHILPISEWNNDRLSPAEVVAENLQLLQHNLKLLVSSGGGNVIHTNTLVQDVQMLNYALKAATDQGWKFTLDTAADPAPFFENQVS